MFTGHTFIIHPSTDRELSSVYLPAVGKMPAVDMDVQLYLRQEVEFFGYNPRCAMAGSDGSSILVFPEASTLMWEADTSTPTNSKEGSSSYTLTACQLFS